MLLLMKFVVKLCEAVPGIGKPGGPVFKTQWRQQWTDCISFCALGWYMLVPVLAVTKSPILGTPDGLLRCC